MYLRSHNWASNGKKSLDEFLPGEEPVSILVKHIKDIVHFLIGHFQIRV